MATTFDGNMYHPDRQAVDEDTGRPRQPHSELVAQTKVYAHQSAYGGEHVVTVIVDAPAGVTVRLTVNDGDVYEDQVPN